MGISKDQLLMAVSSTKDYVDKKTNETFDINEKDVSVEGDIDFSTINTNIMSVSELIDIFFVTGSKLKDILQITKILLTKLGESTSIDISNKSVTLNEDLDFGGSQVSDIIDNQYISDCSLKYILSVNKWILAQINTLLNNTTSRTWGNSQTIEQTLIPDISDLQSRVSTLENGSSQSISDLIMTKDFIIEDSSNVVKANNTLLIYDSQSISISGYTPITAHIKYILEKENGSSATGLVLEAYHSDPIAHSKSNLGFILRNVTSSDITAGYIEIEVVYIKTSF